jgi:hypothetical protein
MGPLTMSVPGPASQTSVCDAGGERAGFLRTRGSVHPRNDTLHGAAVFAVDEDDFPSRGKASNGGEEGGAAALRAGWNGHRESPLWNRWSGAGYDGAKRPAKDSSPRVSGQEYWLTLSRAPETRQKVTCREPPAFISRASPVDLRHGRRGLAALPRERWPAPCRRTSWAAPTAHHPLGHSCSEIVEAPADERMPGPERLPQPRDGLAQERAL